MLSVGANVRFTATPNASGVATFTVTIAPSGSYSRVVKSASGAVLSTQTVKVLGMGADSGSLLSSPGFDGTGLAVGGGLLVLAAAGAVLVALRHRTAQVPVFNPYTNDRLGSRRAGAGTLVCSRWSGRQARWCGA